MKPDHYRGLLDSGDTDTWIEVHPENYMVDGGPRLNWLEILRSERSLSFHGVGASLGGLDPLDADHAGRLRHLIDRYQPEQVSEHAAWCAHAGTYFSDLLPLPRTREAMDNLVNQIDAFQNAIGRTILIENPTNYLPFVSEMDEPDFLVETSKRAGCGLLIDLNNIWISANNVGFEPLKYLDALPVERVGEIHIAGHDEDPVLGDALLIDSHGSLVSESVWTLLHVALERFGPKPVLVERDANIPPFEDLKRERDRADAEILSFSTEAHVAAE